MHIHNLLPVSMLMLSLVACGTASPASLSTPTSLFSALPSAVSSPVFEPTVLRPEPPTPVVPPAATTDFAVAVIVDATNQQVTREQAQAVVGEASGFLRAFSPYGLAMSDFTSDSGGGSMQDIANRYLSMPHDPAPNGLVIFSYGDGGQARASGGYGFSMPNIANARNAFVSPAGADNLMYVAVVDYSYKYMACGYGGAGTVSSTVSLPGECRGQTGVACVAGNGYSMCPNAVGNLYTSTPTYAVSSLVVHGLLHNFGPNGDLDHYATAECNARMGYPAGFFDLQESEYYNGLCPFVYEEFTKARRP